MAGLGIQLCEDDDHYKSAWYNHNTMHTIKEKDYIFHFYLFNLAVCWLQMKYKRETIARK